MLKVVFSHIGEPSLLGCQSDEAHPGRLGDIMAELEAHHPGLQATLLDGDKHRLKSSVAIYKAVDVGPDGRATDSPDTVQVKGVEDRVEDADKTLLVSIFSPELLIEYLMRTASGEPGSSEKRRNYLSERSSKLNNHPLFVHAAAEPLYQFTFGKSVNELVTDDLVDVENNKLIPRQLKDAIAELWEVGEDYRLRLFQEEALTHILGQVQKSKPSRRPLLLSIPTGGGKTEAFLIPIISRIFDERHRLIASGTVPETTVRAVVMYPTRALANDQAKRISEILYLMNKEVPTDQKVTAGVLTGDTPSSRHRLQVEKSVLQVCPNCSSVVHDFIIDKPELPSMARCTCGVEVDFFRLTRDDILRWPPDILITSPDMINRMLQSPKYHDRIFKSSIDVVVLDEIHMYESVFGCNVAHLLRRMEEACDSRPVYIGVSATIKNARELACSIFDADRDQIRYLRPAGIGESESEERRPYLDYEAGPVRFRHHYAVAPYRWDNERFQKVTTSVLNVVDIIGHSIRDPHFRKTLVFTNYRQDADDVVRYMKDQENRYYYPYVTDIYPRVSSTAGDATQLTKTEEDIRKAISSWYAEATRLGSLYSPGLEIGWHRGGLERDERIRAVNRFSSSRIMTSSDNGQSELPIDVMVATKTLELGIDIGDVTTVVNCGSPFTVNEYTQRVGRAGRRRDSLALTVIDPRNPLDFYFLQHFEKYAHPSPSDFEDAPIIVSNMDVFRTHVLARILDRLALYLAPEGHEEVTVEDLRTFKVVDGTRYVPFSSEWHTFGEILFDEALPEKTFGSLKRWIEREPSLIDGVSEVVLNRDTLKNWWLDKLKQLHRRICGSDADTKPTDNLSGMGARDRELVPDMRTAGPSVGLFLTREGSEDELRDTVSRRQAIATRPVGGLASQGSISFRIDKIKDNDAATEERVRQLFVEHPEGRKAAEFFSRLFGDKDDRSPFPADPRSVLVKVSGFVTPQNLSVKYYPYRFYCPKCGATYSNKQPGDELCKYCHTELRQLTEVYVCGGCGQIFLPPIPKVCPNPDCVSRAEDHHGVGFLSGQKYKYVGKQDLHNEYFRFSALPRLTWKCRKCGTEVNYHVFWGLPESVQHTVDTHAAFGTAQEIATRFLFMPEAYWRQTYDSDGFLRARFNCPTCKNDSKYCKISVKNIPQYHSVVHEYLIEGQEVSPDLASSTVDLSLCSVDVLSLARERYRRFYSYATDKTQVNLERIFADNRYLADTYHTHLVLLRMGDLVEQFLSSPDARSCIGRSDCECGLHRGNDRDDDVEDDSGDTSTHPVIGLQEWEKGRRPDPRRKWCRTALELKCANLEPCQPCQNYDRKEFLSYLLIHTLKHAIISAMPKYTGINKNQVRGYVYPNDERTNAIGLVDTVAGGSGSFYLLRANWAKVWQVVGEILDTSRNDPGCLLLPYGCSRYNRDLCPELASAFYRFVEQGAP